MKKLVLGIMVVWFFGIGSLAAAQETITIAGTGASQALLTEMAKAFEAAHPGKKIEVPDSIDSSGGVKWVAKGRCELGRVSRALKEKEKKYNLNHKVFGFSPLVFVVNDTVDIDNLTSRQVLDICSGKVTNWKTVGGTDNRIYVVQREKGDSARLVLRKSLPGFKEIAEPVGLTAYSVLETLDLVKTKKSTMGYVGYAAAKLSELKILTLDGVYPNMENIKKGNYKLVTPFGLVWKGELSGLAKEFFDFLYSADGRALISQNGVIPAE